ncbi:hypothetical protein ACFOOP_14235 [Marinicaulis aureus]|uniref:Uncharacterized protein n=1 Tax=Hyphococcus aureus TaxID=2666033 RepID=A0ABW1KYB8_9PROT
MSRSLKVLAAALFFMGSAACGGSGDSSAAEPQQGADDLAEARAQLAAQTSAPTHSAAPQRPLMQVGPWYPATFNMEEPFINLINASPVVWEGGGMNTGEIVAAGLVDKKTLLPTQLPNGKWLNGGIYFPANSPEMNLHWDGDWVLEWEGDADFWIDYLPREMQWRESKNRIVFTRNFKRGKTLDHSRIQIRGLNGPLKSLKLYRKENEEAVKAGKIYNPAFLKGIAGYDIVRTMDIQSANSATIRSVDDLASMETAFWAATDWGNATGEPQFKYPSPVQGMPIEAALRLGTESGKMIWFQAPITLGAPQTLFDSRPEDGRIDIWAARFSDAAGADAVNVIESEEWDVYADAFVEALIASGYPADRPLYVSLANEVWNFGGQYFLTTTYAQRMGWGLAPWLGIPKHNGLREGYGALMARFKLAVDGALERAGRDQSITYVVEGQAAYVELTGAALRGAKAYMDKKGERWAEHAPGFGVSVASYWGYHEGLTESGIDPSDLDALEDYFLNGSDRLLGTRANVLKLFRGAAAQGAQYGVKLIGAYEGGSHFTRPCKTWDPNRGCVEYAMTTAQYREFQWGERGGRINYEINKALADEFPGVILSNYVLAGPPGGQPWFEGPIGAENPYARSWEALMAHEEAAAGE